MTHKLTANKLGFEHPINKINQAFIDYSATHNPVLDIGSAYGRVVFECFKAGCVRANTIDREVEHYLYYSNKLEANDEWAFSKGDCYVGVFPKDFKTHGTYLEWDNLYEAIHMSHILEYLNPKDTEKGLKLVYKWLKPGGKLFINVYTPWIADFNHPRFQEEFVGRIMRGRHWPGYIEHFRSWWLHPEADEPPVINVHLHTFELVNYLEYLGFKIELAEYMDAREEGGYPRSFSDGRELLGIIAVKH